jgi:hypothetical protein
MVQDFLVYHRSALVMAVRNKEEEGKGKHRKQKEEEEE